ncbi:transcription factor BHLH3-like isoform X2 [Mangifera indica]|uniref:transcription factor BHLH3-like isoform X2 n=1 Tax=Mangifera indica TaxID=29780 RepID=UPI001CFB4767|nr:transcription factor BHLH3-like isoform X2 [Mangifera indica]
MSSRQKKSALHEKLMQLRDVTKSTALNKTSIVVDATEYIEELKQKVESLNQEIGTSEMSTVQNSLPVVTVEALEKGFLINVYSEKNSPNLLVSILEAFEKLGLEVLDARVSCTDSFQLEAMFEGDNSKGHAEGLDAQVVEQAVLQAINNLQE